MSSEKPLISLISSMVCTRSLTDAIIEIKQTYGDIFRFRLFFINDLNKGMVTFEDFKQLIYDTSIMLMDIRGNNPAVEELVKIYHEMQTTSPAQFKAKTIISLVGGNAELRALTKMGSFEAKKIPSKKQGDLNFDEIPDLTDLVKKGIRISSKMAKMGKLLPIGMMRHIRNWTMAMDYWVYGYSGVHENHKNLILFLLREYVGIKDIQVSAPIKIPELGIYHPLENRYYSTLDAFLADHPLDPAKQSIGIFYYGGIYFEQTLPILREFMENLSEFNIIPVYSEVLRNLDALQQFFFHNGRPLVGLVVNLQYFQINGGPFGGDNTPTLNIYQRLDAPQFNPVINFDMPVDEYLASKQGILPINQIIAVVMPELDGRIEMMTVGCMEHLGDSEEIESGVFDIIPLRENITFIAKRIRKWMRLRSKTNADKKVALILYDYPPGEATIGNASYLDVMVSTQNLIKILEKEGYNIGNFPKNQEISEVLLQAGLVNQPEHINPAQFRGTVINQSQYNGLIKDLPSSLTAEIEQAWGSFPGTVMVSKENIFLPIAQFGNIYIGIQPPRTRITDHANNYHNQALPPHHQYMAFYRHLEYNLDVDAIINVGTHGTLEFLPGKEAVGHCTDFNILLQGSTPNLYIYHVSNTSESAIAKRRSNAVIINHAPPPIKISDLYEQYERLDQLILEYNRALHDNTGREAIQTKELEEITQQIHALAKELEIGADRIELIEASLYRLKVAAIPTGLHIFGHPFLPHNKLGLIIEILLHSPAIPIDIREIVDLVKDKGKVDVGALEAILYKAISTKIDPQFSINSTEFSNKDQLVLELPPNLEAALITWITDLWSRLDTDLETQNLIRGLEGGYIRPGFGGDPIRTPEIFPTGRNSYGFDPRLIPSGTAYKRGYQIAENLLKEHSTQNGRFPETVSLVLWAFETMKTGGETIGQIFNYLGVRPIKQKSVWTTELEIIPLSEMRHPRINVVITICGIFRDTFPYLMDLINQAIELVAAQDETLDQNYVKKSQLTLDPNKGDLSLARIFGPPPGKYNTNLTDIIGKGEWKEEKELAEDYISNMGHAYLKNQIIKAAPTEFRQNIGQVEYISQIRDGSEYQITDLDHYYEFSGGFIKAAEEITAKRAPLYIADTSSVEIRVNTADKMIQDGVITRNLNPKWLDGMLKHKFHGAQKVAERVENLLGFSATTHQVENWIWEKSYERYIEDEEYRQKLSENNRFATMKLIKTLLEAEQRGYWNTSEDHVENLKRIYLDLEGWVEKNYSAK